MRSLHQIIAPASLFPIWTLIWSTVVQTVFKTGLIEVVQLLRELQNQAHNIGKFEQNLGSWFRYLITMIS